MALCDCSSGGGNLGRPSCYEVFGTAKQLIFVEYYKADGSVNGIDVANDLTNGIVDQAFLDSKTGALDSSDRWYPSPTLVSVTDERADATVETIDNTTTVFIEDGVRTFEAFTLKGDPVFVGNMNSWRCLTAGVFAVDKDGNLQGAEVVDGILYPVRLQDESLNTQLVKTSVANSTSAKSRITFSISELEDDANLKMIGNADITGTLVGISGLVDASSDGVSNIATTGFDVQLNTPYGSITSPIAAEGLSTSDFEVYNETTLASVVITSVTESTTVDGYYTFVFAAQTSADVLTVGNKVSGELDKGYDVSDFTVTIP